MLQEWYFKKWIHCRYVVPLYGFLADKVRSMAQVIGLVFFSLEQGFESLASKTNVCLPAIQAASETNECLRSRR